MMISGLKILESGVDEKIIVCSLVFDRCVKGEKGVNLFLGTDFLELDIPGQVTVMFDVAMKRMRRSLRCGHRRKSIQDIMWCVTMCFKV